MQTLIDTLWPQLLDLIVVILAPFIAAALVAIRRYFTAKLGATTTQALADMLHRALETGAKAAVAANPGATPGDLVADAIRHAEASIPETLAKLAPSKDALAGIARAKIADALSWASFGK